MKSQNCEVKSHNYLFIFYSVVGKELPYFSLVFFLLKTTARDSVAT